MPLSVSPGWTTYVIGDAAADATAGRVGDGVDPDVGDVGPVGLTEGLATFVPGAMETWPGGEQAATVSTRAATRDSVTPRVRRPAR
jgi:hypothetical protein